LFDRIHRIITTTKNRKKHQQKRFCNLYLSELGSKLIDDKREEEKSKCIRDKIPIYIQGNKWQGNSAFIVVLHPNAYGIQRRRNNIKSQI
jgi:hypothetical protein